MNVNLSCEELILMCVCDEPFQFSVALMKATANRKLLGVWVPVALRSEVIAFQL